MGSSKTKTKSSNGLDSWMTDPLKNAFSNASKTYNATGSPSDYGINESSYNTYSPLNSTEQQGINNAAAGGNLESSLGTTLSSLGTTGGGALNGLLGNMRNGYGTGTSTAGNAAVNGADAYSTGAQNALTSASDLAGTNATSSNLQDASQYTNNPTVKNLINSAVNKSNLNYNETTEPTLNADAVAGGNLNSSRAGAAAAIAEANQKANNENTAATIENNAYNTGLQTAEQAREANMSGLMNAAGTNLTGLNTALTGQDSNNSQLNNYIQNYMNAANSGVSTGTTGASLANQGGADTYNAGLLNQQDMENAKSGMAGAYSDYTNARYNNLDNLMDIIGKANGGWGGHSTSTKTETGSIMQDILGVMGAGGSLFKTIKGGL